MQYNMGGLDRTIRLLASAAIVVLWLGGYITGLLAGLLGIVAVALFVTSLIGWCPLYTALGFSTKRAAPRQT